MAHFPAKHWSTRKHRRELSLYRGVYTIVSNKYAHGRKGCIIAIVKGTKAKDVIKVLKKIEETLRMSVIEVTLDFSESMHSIVETCFPKAMITLDRFHHQQFCLEALQEVRREYRREQMTKDANAREEHRLKMKELAKNDGPWIDAEGNAIRRNAKYYPERLENDETRAELLARSKGLLMMSPDKWTETQKVRAEILSHQDCLLAYPLPEDDFLTAMHKRTRRRKPAFVVYKGGRIRKQGFQRHRCCHVRKRGRNSQLLCQSFYQCICRISQCKDQAIQIIATWYP